MAESNDQLGKEIANRNQNTMAPALVVQKKLELWQQKYADKLIALAGKKFDPDQIFAICMNTISRTPKLLECPVETLGTCILTSYQLKLFPGPFQECAYVPLWNGKTQRTEANFWPMYQGINKLMINAGNRVVIARVVRENDLFIYKEGQQQPVFQPAVTLGKKRGKILFTYAAVCSPHGMWRVEVMDEDQIMAIKNRSPGAKKSDSPWNSKNDDDVDAMRAKTALKRISKFCNKSAELVRAIDLDNAIDGDDKLQTKPVIDLSNIEPLSSVTDNPLPGKASDDSSEEENDLDLDFDPADLDDEDDKT